MKNQISICLFFLFFGSSFTAIAQCGTGGLTLSNQASIDNFTTNFAGCTNIVGSLTISGSDITNLNGLSVITSVGGDLYIQNNPILASLSGLSSLNHVGGYIIINSNAILTSLTGLSGLSSANRIQIEHNPSLLNLSGLSSLTSIQRLIINNNSALTSLSALSALTAVGDYLIISNNAVLASLSGLSSLVSAFLIQIDHNAALLNLSGLSALNSIGILEVDNNSALTSLSGLTSLTSLSNFYISNNASLTSLSALSGITSVSSVLIIRNNALLTSLSGLSSLTTVGALTIDQNVGLTSVAGLTALTNVPGGLYLATNSALPNLSGFSGLTGIGNYMGIEGNLNLTSLTGLSGVTFNLWQYLKINDNPALPNLNGLSGISSVGQQIEIKGNTSLTTLSGLLGVNSIGSYLDIRNNDVLPSLYGLDNISPTSITNLYLQNSDILSYCNVPSICNYLSIPANPASIFGNAANCDTRLAIEGACLTLPIEMVSFSGTRLGNQNILHWATSTEINNDYFVIERSANGVSFEKIGVVKGANNSDFLLKYEYPDRSPYNGINYYRLKQVDTDGTFAFSNIISMQDTHGTIFSLYPNPAHNELYVTELLQNSNYTIENSYGQVVQTGVLTPSGAILVAPLAQGLYFIHFDNQVLKFVKQ